MSINLDDHPHDHQTGYEDGHHDHPGRQWLKPLTLLTWLTRLTLSVETVEGM